MDIQNNDGDFKFIEGGSELGLSRDELEQMKGMTSPELRTHLRTRMEASGSADRSAIEKILLADSFGTLPEMIIQNLNPPPEDDSVESEVLDINHQAEDDGDESEILDTN